MKIKATAKIARRASPRNVKSPSPEVVRQANYLRGVSTW